MSPQDVLDFWFLPPGSPGHGEQRALWFRKDDEVDAAIKTRFGGVLEQAVAGGLREWDEQGAAGVLARILVLDQFTRNAWRGTPASFSGDALALAAAEGLVARGADRGLTPLQRWFVYMPFEHAEDARMQEQSVALFGALAAENPGFEGALDYAHKHRGVIARFGRFPHRNPILGRASTPEEVDYLAQPGSGF
ncbi:DUF924 family protein [Massilia sp. CF038]|uniref:DUF924 family protein n=1 Tax=Massilia sp. CF038 TaxID=1881045 RepID=UPI000910A4EE|nr:DUF924 family protein [Massilia sp. CF038]SHH42901.1 Uncharacterized conserved protein, DUF924 family [Massilia sp. CF038]